MSNQNQLSLISVEDYVEGIFGIFGILVAYQLTKSFKKSSMSHVAVAMTFLIMWGFRKFLLGIYKKIRYNSHHSNDTNKRRSLYLMTALILCTLYLAMCKVYNRKLAHVITGGHAALLLGYYVCY